MPGARTCLRMGELDSVASAHMLRSKGRCFAPGFAVSVRYPKEKARRSSGGLNSGGDVASLLNQILRQVRNAKSNWTIVTTAPDQDFNRRRPTFRQIDVRGHQLYAEIGRLRKRCQSVAKTISTTPSRSSSETTT